MDYEKYLSDGVKIIKPSGIRKFFDVADIYKDVISLGVGEPDFDTPWDARECAVRSIRKGLTQYTSNSGLPILRQNISKYLLQRYNLDYDWKTEMFVTVGASEGIDLCLRAMINQGDEVIIPEPSYVSYSPCVILCGGKPVSAKCTAENGFSLTAESLRACITPRTKVLILPYPNNPTGGIMTKAQLEDIRQIIIDNDIFVLSDEIYSELTYNLKHTSIATLQNMRERTIVINGFSKAFAMTGWRIGYICAPQPLIKAMLKIHQYVIMCAPTMSQYCANEALERGFVENFLTVQDMKEQYDMRRRYLVGALNDMGLTTFEPHGAFYVFPCVSSLGMTGEEFANQLLQEEHVAVVPGDAFGESGKNYVRISYAYSITNLQKAMAKMRNFCLNHKI
ncbi:MAG: aminotransferase class I/II-fold pyridoxal phosphate-dependent enzyme [Clostridia bacterium]